MGVLGLLRIDFWLEAGFIDYVTPYKRAPVNEDLAIILVEAEHKGALVGATKTELRGDYANLVRALADGGAAVVAFDFIFKDQAPDENLDRRFADAIRRAGMPGQSGKPTTVIVGASQGRRSREPLVTESPILASALSARNWGLIDVGFEQAALGKVLWRIELAKRKKNRSSRVEYLSVIPSLPLQVFVHAHIQEGPPGRDSGGRPLDPHRSSRS